MSVFGFAVYLGYPPSENDSAGFFSCRASSVKRFAHKGVSSVKVFFCLFAHWFFAFYLSPLRAPTRSSSSLYFLPLLSSFLFRYASFFLLRMRLLRDFLFAQPSEGEVKFSSAWRGRTVPRSRLVRGTGSLFPISPSPVYIQIRKATSACRRRS